jgi:AP-1 complex subunit mu
MASSLFILDLKGKTLLCRNYRGDIPMSAVDKFMPLMYDLEEEGKTSPIFTDEGINYLYIKHNNVYLLALTRRNSNAFEILQFLHKVVQVLTEYFKELEEESIRDNFVVIYELLDEMMDFGHPQTTETKILQEYITQESHRLEVQARPPVAVTNAVSWRSEGIRYRKNEVFLDVVESVNLMVSSTGNVVRSEILGAVKMKCFLSGMPELRLGLNDKAMFESTGRTSRGKSIEMEDVKFHQCVRLSRFENDRTISFIPPDGDFELMSYRLSSAVKPLIWVETIQESHSGSRLSYMIKAKAQFKRRSTANNVEILIPFQMMQIHLVSVQVSVLCITHLNGLLSSGLSSNSVVVESFSCVQNLAYPASAQRHKRQPSALSRSSLRFHTLRQVASKCVTSRSSKASSTTLHCHGYGISRKTVNASSDCRSKIFA